jgi:hypothetical protein
MAKCPLLDQRIVGLYPVLRQIKKFAWNLEKKCGLVSPKKYNEYMGYRGPGFESRHKGLRVTVAK